MEMRFSDLLRYIAFPIIMGACLLCVLLALAAVLIAPEGLNPAEAIVLRIYLLQNNNALNTPKGTDPTLRRFEVTDTDTAQSIGVKLVTEGFINNGTLFKNYVRYEGLDKQLRAGIFFISETMTTAEIARELTNPIPQTVTLVVIEGWRKEQIAEAIDAQPMLNFSGNDFLALVGEGAPLPPDFQQKYNIPSGASLEGFLFPATYEVYIGASAAELRDQMLDAFDRNITAQMRGDVLAQNRTMFEVVTLASIVEREAIIPEERPQIAGVYLNRLDGGVKLDADPTVQYGIGNSRDGNWWTRLSLQDYQYSHPYNTYIHTGLPPGPIASPGIASIRAVIYPAIVPYFYFQAACDSSGRHVFSITYEEHLSKSCTG
jgi:UPF0755 protein